MPKKIIIHLIQSLDSGGCENMLLRSLPLIKKFEHVIITLRKRGELASKFEEKGIKVLSVNQHSMLDFNSYIRLIKIIKSIKPNLIITYLFHADIIGRLVLQSIIKTKVIPFLRTSYNHKKYWQARMVEKITKRWAAQYLANSESVKNYYVKHIGVNRNKITVIPNGIDTNYYDKIAPDHSLRMGLGINEKECVLICVANLHVNKGHKYLLEAFESLYKRHKDIQILIVGDGVEKNNLKNQIKEYESRNNVHFLGKRGDIPKLLKISDIFVLPTLFEGMSNAIMEAMASGLPVVSTDIAENRELISTQDTGVLVHTSSSKALGEALEVLIDNSKIRRSLGQNGKSAISTKYDINHTTSKLSDYIYTYTE